MTATPIDIWINIETQDQAGFRANSRLNVGYLPDGTISTAVVGDLINEVFANGASSVAGAFAAMTNAKVVRVSIGFDMDWATEPTGESGSYKYVITKARALYEDGKGEKEVLSIPAPKDSLFLTGTGMQTTLDPTNTSLVGSTSLPHYVGLYGPWTTARGGTWGAQFFGGQLVNGKPRRRRVNQGQ
jgi:hypothetical protein